MGTTLTIEDDAVSKAQAEANAGSLKPGQAVWEVIRRGTAVKLPMKQKNGVWIFQLPPGTPRVTAKQVKDMMASATRSSF